MGSLRNPIGPLPSSIYWRRRAVALAIVALLALLVVWALNLGGNSGKTGNEGKGAEGSGPAESITPGPSGTGPAITQKPGGRDSSGGSGESGSDSGGGSGSSGGGSGSGGSDGSGAGGSGGGAPIGEGSGGGVVPAGSPLPNCASGAGKLTLRSVEDSYRPGEKPKFELTVKNTAGSACKVDLGRKAAVLTITDDTADDDRVWASNDCPSGTGSALLQVPAKGSVKRTIEWDRRASAPQCATPSAAAVPAGKYRIEAEVPGLSPVHTFFVLAKGD
ncbi:hypothetical protein FCH28_33030 [Streptomyces piniterrae]|uniref:DUF4232 domain-containing protein n=1 Tax=Streptomyces piniterrae TaxID=2571125 RepID=A0A4U0MPM0_9ACTN|nr:hypothetical protein [Streptomyces piniterrae]TJZ42730.1 hypothetical protein FCH28_33030 [Streptomyces piniterrae]